MNQAFPLGIYDLWRELRDIPAGGIWWINTETQEQALRLINDTLAAQSSDARVSLLFSDSAVRRQFSLEGGGPERVWLYTFKPTRACLMSLRYSLTKKRGPEGHLVILLCPNALWDSFKAPELRQWLQSLNQWLFNQGVSLLIINPVRKPERLVSLLINEYRGLNGLATLRNPGEEYRLDVEFWCNEFGVSARQNICLTLVEGHLQQKVVDNAAPQPLNDARAILSHLAVLEGAPALSEHWTLFEDNALLYDAARTAQAATIIFLLTQNSQIEQLATQVHSLRRQRGGALKLVIREKNASLRTADERLLLGCGASLIVPWNAPLSRCLSLIESIQDQKFSRHVPEDIQVLLNAVQPLKIRGFQKWDAFCQAIENLLSNLIIPEDNRGVLVALRPVPGLTVGQMLTLCRPGRMGDIMTPGDNRLYLFLSFCRINDLDIALKHIFPLPIDDLISNRVAWFEDRQIAAELSRMRLSDPTPSGQPLEEAELQPQTCATPDSRSGRRQPQPVTLLSDIHGEAPV